MNASIDYNSSTHYAGCNGTCVIRRPEFRNFALDDVQRINEEMKGIGQIVEKNGKQIFVFDKGNIEILKKNFLKILNFSQRNQRSHPCAGKRNKSNARDD